MKRAKVGSLLFVGATILILAAPSAQSSALADTAHQAQDDDGPNRKSVGTKLGAGGAANGASGAAATNAKTALVNASVRTVTPKAAQDLGASGSCPANMVEVEGDYCPTLEQKCTKWMDPENTVPRRCAEFAPTGACQGKAIKKHFCIDRFEYPNKVGEKPVVMKTWYEAADACKGQGKRLCGDSEWTLACEGQERLPYPYGYTRNAEACNIDKPHPDVNEKALANPMTRDAEVARLWQGETSGSREACVSPYGAFDMTGNVDEWVVNESGMPYKSGLKGGYWGPVRDRCRPMTTAHFEQFSFYQIGFRCCSDDVENPTNVAKPAHPGFGAPAGRGPASNPAPGALVTGS
ncbi:Protein kinase domain protein [Labilithrix luteola]|uniref:Protein kinase domain protein n=1 Tax=Labilithrix luteola TaxID=1391654 RepID=A0A0K1Q8V6_9BACT|nr:SUMF1/EgtB/PvdO family nonheme iron enzyme [Labilithrix luteola]AKV01845.1 Protein kinase domain protein [Labilithrix luteola]